MSRLEPSQPSLLAKFVTWMLMCAIAWTSVLSGYSSGSLRVADDLSTKITKDHEVAGCGRQDGDSGFAYDDYEDAAFAHLSGSSEQAVEAVTYTYDDQCEHARSRAMGETLHPCCNGDSYPLSSKFRVISLQSFTAVAVNGRSSCDYDESRWLLERKSHVGDFEMSFYSYDGLGSVRGLTDAIGTSLGQYHYDAYGLLIENTVSVANPYQFAGERYDSDLGLYYLRARYLDVETGRFWSLDDFEGDRMESQSLHKYLYAHANPVNMVDPSGNNGVLTLGELSFTTGQMIGLSTLGLVAYDGLANQLKTSILAVESLYLLAKAAGEGFFKLAGNLIKNWKTKVLPRVKAAMKKSGQGLKKLAYWLKRTLFVVRSVMPTIYAFNVSALARNPSWYKLRYNGPYSPRTKTNRAWVMSTYASMRLTAPKGFSSLDEFPFASTSKGGPKGPALGAMVPLWENHTQGGVLSVFYRFSALRGKAGSFLVVPLPL